MLHDMKHLGTRLRRSRTPQDEPILGTTQRPNSAGGYAWTIDAWARLDRYLILGSEGGTYYVAEQPLTVENANAALECIAADGLRVVRRTIEISESGRAARNDPALLVLALCASVGDEATRAAALAALDRVARTGTHLFHWLRYMKACRGWGRSVRRAVSRWYTGKPAGALAHQLLKYRARDGWSHRDALRLAHPTAPTYEHDLLFRYATAGWDAIAGSNALRTDVGGRLEAVHAIRQMSPADAARVIRIYGLTREMLPTAMLRHAEVWEALLDAMPLTALVRNLGVMSTVGLLVPGSAATRRVVSRLANAGAVRRARLHPLAVLAALRTYARGRGARGSGRWTPVPEVVDALDGAYYLAFANAPVTNRRLLLALDVSASMLAPVHGLPYLTCREASAAMALVIAATEPAHRIVAFTAGEDGSTRLGLGSAVTPLPIAPRQRLHEVLDLIGALRFGGTDCALPMLDAARHRWPVDAFVILTDSETWAGRIHPAEALRAYRERMGIAAKLVIVAMTSNGFSIADPNDEGMLDVVGFDAATPAIISEFVA